MSTLRVSNIEAKADPSSPSVDEKLKVTNSNGDVLVHIDGKTAGITTVGINTTDRSFTVDAAQNVEFLGIVTATKFSLSGGGEITGGDGNFTGIVTSTSISATDSTIGVATITSLTASAANFTGNVSIAGTLTYEDVTNVDSIGIATARTGIDVTGGHIDLVDNSKIRVGTGDDLQIYHDENNSWISDEGTGSLKIRSVAGQVQILGTGSNDNMAVFTVDGASELYYDNSKKLETTTTGAKVTGALEVTQEYPSIRPTLDLNFAATKTLDRRITFRRDSLGTFIGEDGLLKYAPNNMPRFDHDPNTGESLGLLIEESGTNTKTNSQVFTSGWNRSGIEAVTQNTSIVTPSGSTDSTGVGVLTESSGGTSHQFYAASSSQVTKYITYSIFAKPNGRNHIKLVTSGFVHNLADGTTSGSASGEFISAKTEKLSNGWCRCSVVRNHSNSYDQFNVKLSNGSSTSYSGDGSSGVYIWGVQQEDSEYLTSYIPTSGSTVTRAADIAKITGTNFTDFYNQSEGTIIAEYRVPPEKNDSTIWGITGASDADRIIHYLRAASSGSFRFDTTVSSAFTNAIQITNPRPNVYKTGLGIFPQNIKAIIDGGTLYEDTGRSGNIPTVTQLLIGNITTTSTGSGLGHMSRLSYYNKRLPDAQLQGLTQQ